MTTYKIPPLWFAIPCALGAELGQIFIVSLDPSVVLPVFWPPAGFLIGALILSAPADYRTLSLITLAISFVSMALHGRPIVLSAALSVISVAGACLTAWGVRRVIDRSFTMHRVADILVLIAAASLVPMASGTLVAGILNLMYGTPAVTAWRAWWLQEAIGAFFFVPIVTEAVMERRALGGALRSWRTVEAVIAFVGAAVMTAGIFGELLPPLVRLPAYVLPFVLWPALRSGPAASAATLLAIAVVACWHTMNGMGPFALDDASPERLLLRAQGAMVIMSVSFMLFAGIIAERKRDAQERARLIIELQQALAEIKTLQGLIPICAWCHKVRDDAGFWQKLETYLGEETGATFSHSICPTCEQRAHDEITKHGIALPL